MVAAALAGRRVRLPRSFSSIWFSDSGFSVSVEVTLAMVTVLCATSGLVPGAVVAVVAMVALAVAKMSSRVVVCDGRVVSGYRPVRSTVDLGTVDGFEVVPLSETPRGVAPWSVWWTVDRPDESWKWDGRPNRGPIRGSGLLGAERRRVWLDVLDAARLHARDRHGSTERWSRPDLTE